MFGTATTIYEQYGLHNIARASYEQYCNMLCVFASAKNYQLSTCLSLIITELNNILQESVLGVTMLENIVDVN